MSYKTPAGRIQRAFKIGALARRTGTTAPTVRYYEQIGLMPHAERGVGGQRSYGSDAMERLAFIRRCRAFGFSIEQVRALVSLMQDRNRSCTEARDLAAVHLASVRAKRAELAKLEKSIAGLVRSCETSCLGGPGPDCVVVGDLATAERAATSRTQPPRRSASEPRCQTRGV